MKGLLSILFIACMILSSCNHHPNGDSGKTGGADSGSVSQISSSNYSRMLKEPIVNSKMHYFSDSAAMDSFVIEIPAGDIFTSKMHLRIYNHSNELIYTDSISTIGFYDEDTNVNEQGFIKTESAIKDLKEGIAGMLSAEHFMNGGAEEIRNAPDESVTDTTVWKEVEANPHRIIYLYADVIKGATYVACSRLSKQASVIIHFDAEDED